MIPTFAALNDDALYAELQATYTAYQTASWDEIDGLQERSSAIRGEMERRQIEKDTKRLAAAGLPLSWARG